MEQTAGTLPTQCPSCAAELAVTRLACPACRAEVHGVFPPRRLVNLPEPHASLLELFIRLRGNVKDVERALGLSYPTVRARLDEAFAAARPKLEAQPPSARPDLAADRAASDAAARRGAILDQLERGEIGPSEAIAAIARLRDPQHGQNWRSR